MIPVYTINGVPVYEDPSATYRFIRISETPEADRELLAMWMMIQTRPWLPDIEDAVYIWDYKRFLRTLKGEPVLWD